MSTLDEILQTVGGLNPEQIQEAKTSALQKKVSLLFACEELPGVDGQRLGLAFSKFYNIQLANLANMEIPPAIIKLLPPALAQEIRVIPIDRAGNNLIIATGDPKNLAVLNRARQKTGYAIKPVLALEGQISAALARYYGENLVLDEFAEQAYEHTNINNYASAKIEIRHDITGEGANDGPIIALVNKIMTACFEKGASDIHIEPYEKEMRVRLRIDGTLLVVAKPKVELKDSLTTRIKIMAGINIAERRLPQDGGIRVSVDGRPIDFRVNTLPTIYGEKIVLRILDKSNLDVDMTKLGFEPDDLKKLMDSIHKPYGMVLVTGPTGSGKTTTLYSALSELNKSTENIMTAEDPVEYNLEGINQVQMRADIGLDFAAALRAFLRQDPDVIMVGEIRDIITAEIAVKAALTGHMVLSTLHTNSAADTVVRLLNMGVESFNLVSALTCIVAQRLTKKNCEHCRVVDESITPEVLITMGVHPQYAPRIRAYKGKGCPKCSGTGMKGRVAVQEVMVITDPLRDAIVKGLPAMDVKRIAMQGGMRTLRQAALVKMAQGVIPASEVIKNTNSDTDQISGAVNAA